MEPWRGMSLLGWTGVFYLLTISMVDSNERNCDKLHALVEYKLLTNATSQTTSSTGGRRCTKDGSPCCTSQMEETLLVEGKKQLIIAVNNDIAQLQSLLLNRYSRFNDFFTTLLLESKRDFDQMFKATYGIVYEENSYVFTDLFGELERYYEKGQVDLEVAMENFFNTLYQKMFTVMNSQYQFDEQYLNCVGDHMKDLKPFGDVPRKLSVQIKRSFVATRTFAQALNIGKDVALQMQALNLRLIRDCPQAIMRMSYCPYCRGLSEVKPCEDYCLNVMRGCLAYHTELNREWNNYLEAIDKVVARLLGPFNIQNVVEPINIKISEAIMNFQENAHEVSDKIFSGCGRPFLNRRGRDTREIELQSYKFNNQDTNGHWPPTLNKLIKDIRLKLKETKNFWNNLPYRICNTKYNVSKTSCWNGTHVASYTHSSVRSGLNAQASNPEVSVDISRPSSVLNEQVNKLQQVNHKLKNAFNGGDVKWVDRESISYESSGDGSGDKFTDDDEDAHSGFIAGSGHRPKGPLDQEDDDDDDDDDPVDGSTPKQSPPLSPPSTNDESNVIPNGRDDVRVRGGAIPPPTTTITTHNTSSGANAHKQTRMSLLRVVIGYLFPICVIWFGGFFPDWL